MTRPERESGGDTGGRLGLLLLQLWWRTESKPGNDASISFGRDERGGWYTKGEAWSDNSLGLDKRQEWWCTKGESWDHAKRLGGLLAVTFDRWDDGEEIVGRCVRGKCCSDGHVGCRGRCKCDSHGAGVAADAARGRGMLKHVAGSRGPIHGMGRRVDVVSQHARSVAGGRGVRRHGLEAES